MNDDVERGCSAREASAVPLLGVEVRAEVRRRARARRRSPALPERRERSRSRRSTRSRSRRKARAHRLLDDGARPPHRGRGARARGGVPSLRRRDHAPATAARSSSRSGRTSSPPTSATSCPARRRSSRSSTSSPSSPTRARVRWSIPTLVAPRYIPGAARAIAPAHGVRRPDRSRPRRRSDLAADRRRRATALSLDLTFDLGAHVDVESPSHAHRRRVASGDEARVTFAQRRGAARSRRRRHCVRSAASRRPRPRRERDHAIATGRQPARSRSRCVPDLGRRGQRSARAQRRRVRARSLRLDGRLLDDRGADGAAALPAPAPRGRSLRDHSRSTTAIEVFAPELVPLHARRRSQQADRWVDGARRARRHRDARAAARRGERRARRRRSSCSPTARSATRRRSSRACHERARDARASTRSASAPT